MRCSFILFGAQALALPFGFGNGNKLLARQAVNVGVGVGVDAAVQGPDGSQLGGAGFATSYVYQSPTDETSTVFTTEIETLPPIQSVFFTLQPTNTAQSQPAQPTDTETQAPLQTNDPIQGSISPIFSTTTVQQPIATNGPSSPINIPSSPGDVPSSPVDNPSSPGVPSSPVDNPSSPTNIILWQPSQPVVSSPPTWRNGSATSSRTIYTVAPSFAPSGGLNPVLPTGINPNLPSSSSSPGSIGSIPEALSYSPYNNDKSCKSASQVASDIAKIASKGINRIRVYGTDCGSIETIGAAVIQYDIQLDQGFWIGPDGVTSIDSGVAEFINWANNGNWGRVHNIYVGNEAIYANYVSAQDLINKIASVKSQVQAAGFQGLVTTSEPPSSYISHPEICQSASMDFVAINTHPYFDPNASPETSGSWVLNQISQTQNACGSKQVYIAEVGYPSAGNTNGNNVPSKPNQKIAIAQMMQSLNGAATFFTMYDDGWKDPGPYNVEQHFGIFDLLG